MIWFHDFMKVGLSATGSSDWDIISIGIGMDNGTGVLILYSLLALHLHLDIYNYFGVYLSYGVYFFYHSLDYFVYFLWGCILSEIVPTVPPYPYSRIHSYNPQLQLEYTAVFPPVTLDAHITLFCTSSSTSDAGRHFSCSPGSHS